MKKKENVSINFLEREPGIGFVEAYSNKNVYEFCLLDDSLNGVHHQVRCKDYLQDLFWYQFTKQYPNDVQIFGFYPKSYNNFKLTDREWYNIGIRFRTEGQEFEQFSKDIVDRVQYYINEIESILEFPMSTFYLDKNKKAILSTFSYKWTKKPYLLSLYLLLFRLLTNYSKKNDLKDMNVFDFLKGLPEKETGNDMRHLKNCSIMLDLLREKKFPKQNWGDYKTINEVHSATGVSSYSIVLNRCKNLDKYFN